MALCPDFICKLDLCHSKSANCKETCLIARDVYKCDACLIRDVYHCSDSYDEVQEQRKQYTQES